MPVPSVPRRAAPPRKKPAKPTAPPPPVPEPEAEQEPAPAPAEVAPPDPSVLTASPEGEGVRAEEPIASPPEALVEEAVGIKVMS